MRDESSNVIESSEETLDLLLSIGSWNFLYSFDFRRIEFNTLAIDDEA